jgi:DNA-binding MarR family transcriptional regulator/GNAT superfamily N-acetyltransferase
MPAPLSDQIAAIRAFSRFYTRQIGLLEEAYLSSEFTITEARVLYELAHRDGLTATELGRDLELDAGYLSRILKKFEARGFLGREPSAADARQSVLALTPAGQAAFAPLDKASEANVSAILSRLGSSDRERLVSAMHTVKALFGGPSPPPPYILRDHRPGDMGWIIHRQAVLYAQEYGWDVTFEALVAEITASFVKNFRPDSERCWIAEREGEILGSVFLVHASDELAKLRLLYVEPSARGLGIGRHLVNECVAFARAKGYRTLTLWTNDILVSARRIYEHAGFTLVEEERHRSFGKDLVGQNWSLELTEAPAA